jgi:LysM repeat protein
MSFSMKQLARTCLRSEAAATRPLAPARLLLLLIGCVGLTGCLPSTQRMVEEEKEPHFLEGKRHVNAMDFSGAIDAFEHALQANPHSASAHFELGVLYDQRKAEPATAIYHYYRFLDAHESGEQAQRARERILACKQELARTVSLAPVNQSMQREFDQLIEENRRLKQQLQTWEAYFQHTQGVTNPPPVERAAVPAQSRAAADPLPQDRAGLAPGTRGNAVGGQGTTPTLRIVRTEPPKPVESTLASARTHTVKGGETPAAIARRYNVKVEALMALNPRVDARRLQVGQALHIPSP